MRFWDIFLRLFASPRRWIGVCWRALFNLGRLLKQDDEEAQIASGWVVPKRKALILGVSGSGIPLVKREGGNKTASLTHPEEGIINDPRRDAIDMRQTLMDIYKYNTTDITMLIDCGNPEMAQPTEENITIAMKNLVADACPGDRFYFHYSGHGMQIADDNGDEEDGLDECIITCDKKRIRDDKLKEIMVNLLPPGCSLVCVFDACHSGTLLDLVHYRCNRVYVPWVSKGIPQVERESNLVYSNTSEYTDIIRGPGDNSDYQTGLSAPHHLLLQSPTVLSAEEAARDIITLNTVPMEHPDRHFCTGGCRKDPYLMQDVSQPVANVISLSAAKDYQLSWGPDGCSLTQALIGILEKDKNPKLTNLLKSISHELHKPYIELHQASRKYKTWLQKFNNRRKKQGKALEEGIKVETENFQDPQISSHRPLVKFLI